MQWRDERRWEKSAGGVEGVGGGDIWTSGSVANGVDMACAFMRERWPGELTEVVIGVAGVAERAREYGGKEVEMVFMMGGGEE